MNLRAENAADALRQAFQVERYPVDPAGIAKQLGIDVVRATMEDQLSGMLIRDEDHVAIGVNRAHSRSRQVFTIAHELGHLQMHRGRPLIVDSAVRVNLRDRTSATATSREEIEANAFAAALLMPTALLMDAASRLAGDSQPAVFTARLAKEFGVSEQAMNYRLINLGILNSS